MTPPSITWVRCLSSVVTIVVVVQLPSCVLLFVTSWATACQAPVSSTVSWSLLKFMSIESVMLSNQLILCFPLFFLPSIFPSIRVFSNESALYIRWPKYLLSEPFIWMQIFLQFSLMPRKALLVTGSAGPLGELCSPFLCSLLVI